MTYVVAIVAPGAMGSAIGKLLHENGANVITTLEGRSEASRRRANDAGMHGVPRAGLVNADVILSIVPPGEAVELARQLAPELVLARKKPLFIDCNAISPETVRAVGEVIEAAGCLFVDGCIIGLPPAPGGKSPTFYFSGDAAEDAMRLGSFGLEVRRLMAPIGAASALKMSYAGITKGLTGLAAAMILAAHEAGAGDALKEELASSQSVLLKRFTGALPDMYPKAYRWVAEMREIGQFARNVEGAQQIYDGLALLYEMLADDGVESRSRRRIEAIDAFF